MQRLAIHLVLFVAVALLVTACASSDSDSGTVKEQGSTVPGEKVSSEGGLTPTATGGGPSASIGW
jgi:hypothetical protein